MSISIFTLPSSKTKWFKELAIAQRETVGMWWWKGGYVMVKRRKLKVGLYVPRATIQVTLMNFDNKCGWNCAKLFASRGKMFTSPRWYYLRWIDNLGFFEAQFGVRNQSNSPLFWKHSIRALTGFIGPSQAPSGPHRLHRAFAPFGSTWPWESLGCDPKVIGVLVVTKGVWKRIFGF